MEQHLTTLLQQRWLSKLLGFNYAIKDKKGLENRVADALSRVTDEMGDYNLLIVVQHQWMLHVITNLQE